MKILNIFILSLICQIGWANEVYLECNYQHTMDYTFENSFKTERKHKQKILSYELDLESKKVRDKWGYETSFEESGNIISYFKTFEQQSYYWITEINRLTGKTEVTQFRPEPSYDLYHWRDNEWNMDIFKERDYRIGEVDHYMCQTKTKLF